MILFARLADGSIYRVSANGGTPEQIIAAVGGEALLHPRLLPDGRGILFTAAEDMSSVDSGRIVVQSPGSSDRKEIWPGSDAIYISTGHLIYTFGTSLYAIEFDLDTLEVSGTPVPMEQGLARADLSLSSNVAVSNDGTLVFRRGGGGSAGSGTRTLVFADRDGDTIPITNEFRTYERPRVSPDGTRIAVEVTSNDATHIWLVEIATGIGTQFTFEGSQNALPVWTADGETIVFASDRLGGTPNAIFRKPADLTGTAQLILERDGAGLVWPADLTEEDILVFHEGEFGVNADIWTVDINEPESVEEFLVTTGISLSGRLSTDENWLAYVGIEPDSEPRVYVRPYPRADAGPRQIADQAGFAPVWSPDGRELYWISSLASPTLTTSVLDQLSSLSIGRSEDLFALTELRVSFDLTNIVLGSTYDFMPNGDQSVWSVIADAGEETSDLRIVVVENWFEELKERVPVP